MAKQNVQKLIAAGMLAAGLSATPAKASPLPIGTEYYSGDSYAFEFSTPTNVDWFRINSNILFSDSNKILGYIHPAGYDCQAKNDNSYADFLCQAMAGFQTKTDFGGLTYDLAAFGYAAGTSTLDIKNLYGTDEVTIDFGLGFDILQGTGNMIRIYDNQVATVPLPPALFLMGAGLAGMSFFRRKPSRTLP